MKIRMIRQEMRHSGSENLLASMFAQYAGHGIYRSDAGQRTDIEIVHALHADNDLLADAYDQRLKSPCEAQTFMVSSRDPGNHYGIN